MSSPIGPAEGKQEWGLENRGVPGAGGLPKGCLSSSESPHTPTSPEVFRLLSQPYLLKCLLYPYFSGTEFPFPSPFLLLSLSFKSNEFDMENWVFAQRTTNLSLPNNYIFKEPPNPLFSGMDKQRTNTPGDQQWHLGPQILHSLQRLKCGENLVKCSPKSPFDIPKALRV